MISEATSVGIKAEKATKTVTDKKGNTSTVDYINFTLPEVVTKDTNAFIEKYSLRFFTIDIDNNEIRYSLEQKPEWREYELSDVDGFYSEPFVFVFNEGENIISLEAKNEPIAISDIVLIPETTYISYEEYLKRVERR